MEKSWANWTVMQKSWETSWESWTVKTWIEIAREYGISGYSGKSKKVLIAYLPNAFKAKGISLEEVQIKLEKKPRSRALLITNRFHHK